MMALQGRAAAGVDVPPLPQNLEAEEAVIGAILFSGRCLGTVRPLLEPVDFYHPALGSIFEALIALEAAAQPIDIITTAAQMRTADTFGKLRMHGGEAYLAELSSKVATVENIAHHARMVKRTALQRRAILARGAGYDRALAGLDTAAQDRELIEVAQALAVLDGQARPPLRTVRIGEVPEPGPTRFMIRPIWTAGAFGFVGAEPKAWKTWITLSIAISVASGAVEVPSESRSPVLVVKLASSRHALGSTPVSLVRPRLGAALLLGPVLPRSTACFQALRED